MLDVATGDGFLAFEFAKRVSGANVTGCDRTRICFWLLRAYSERGGLDNVDFRVMDVKSLGFEDGSFDIVSCRFAFHHFTNPGKAVSEMARVCKRGGKIVFVEGLSSGDVAKSEYHNRIEQLRDPSHVRLYSEPEPVGLLEDAGLKVIHARNWDADFYFDGWIKIADTGEEIVRGVRAYDCGFV
ncbi:MAG: methyltransferase domain-containing protein [Euryarchaeota archaeon]|nr:methyltransferase domain-containing protein [Euryarchaeota archaeon]